MNLNRLMSLSDEIIHAQLYRLNDKLSSIINEHVEILAWVRHEDQIKRPRQIGYNQPCYFVLWHISHNGNDNRQ